jgi:hypothetical protein
MYLGLEECLNIDLNSDDLGAEVHYYIFHFHSMVFTADLTRTGSDNISTPVQN